MSLKTIRYALWGAAALAVGALGGALYVQAPFTADTITQRGAIGGPFELIDHNGNDVDQTILEGSPSMIFFGFTHCPEICPTTLADISGWLEAMGEEGKDLKGYFVTVDPERDGPEVMKDYVTAFSDRIVGLTGTPEKVQTILSNYRVFARKVRLGDGDYTMDHTASVILLDRSGNFVSTISYGENEETAVEKLRLLVNRDLTG